MSRPSSLMLAPALAACGTLCGVPGRAMAQSGGAFTINWATLDSGGTTTPIAAGVYSLVGTIGQPDAGVCAGGALQVQSGFWAGITAAPCYANCDNSTAAPVLNVADFTCFLQKYSSGDAYANCDGSTQAPVLNVNDFTCFLQKYSAGCP
jgi:hypothetical protein